MRAIQRLALSLAVWALFGALALAQLNVSSPNVVKDQSSSTTGSAAPTTAMFAGANSSGNLTGVVACDSTAFITVSTITTAQVIALASNKAIYICAVLINGGGATTAKLVSGTGTNCATGLTALTPAFTLATGSNVSIGTGLGYLTKAPSGNALCVTNSAAITANVLVTYTQF
jgi:hypothetical protein